MQSKKLISPYCELEWHPTKNGELKPDDVTCGSGKKVWWKCPKGEDHEWEVTIVDRSNGNGCPFCAGQRATKDKNLAAQFPDLVNEWHPTKNGELKPEDLLSRSGLKVWWKCPKAEDHEWEAAIYSRSGGRDCPFCSGRRASKDNNLTVQNPDLAKEWHPTKNGDLKPEERTFSSGIKVWWKCPKGEGHEWKATPNKRSNGRGCPFCSGRRATLI